VGHVFIVLWTRSLHWRVEFKVLILVFNALYNPPCVTDHPLGAMSVTAVTLVTAVRGLFSPDCGAVQLGALWPQNRADPFPEPDHCRRNCGWSRQLTRWKHVSKRTILN